MPQGSCSGRVATPMLCARVFGVAADSRLLKNNSAREILMLATTALVFFVTIFSSATFKTNQRSCYCRRLLLSGQASATRIFALCTFDMLVKVCLEDLQGSCLLIFCDMFHTHATPRPTTLTVSFAPHLSHVLPLRTPYGSLCQNQAGARSTPPTFRMYTTGDIFETLGAEVVMRYRDVSWTGNKVGAGQHKSNGATRRRQEVSVVEMQVTWVGGCTHILVWLDSVEVPQVRRL